MIVRRLVVCLAAAVALAVAVAPAAGADPAKPTNYRSRVERITPATNAISVKVVGGDGFLELEVQRGHTATVEGYEGEPWLRVLADGRVQENQSSTATYLNVSRYGSTETVTIPTTANKTNARLHPIWKTVDTNGRYVWHDHRIHYMTPQIAPRFVPGTNRVAIGIRTDGRWVVPMTVDRTPTLVIGSLVLFPAPSPVLPWLVVVLVALGVALASWRLQERGALVAAGAVLVAGAFALLSGWHELAVVPAQAGANPIAVALPAFAVLAALVALGLRGVASRTIAVLAGAAALSVWAALRVPSFGKALPLGDLSPTFTRLISAGALGAAVGAAIGVVAAGGLALRLEPLDEDDDDLDGNEPVDDAGTSPAGA